MKREANLMQGAFKRCGVVRLLADRDLPPAIVHVEPDGRQGIFVLNRIKPPLCARNGALEVEKQVYDYRQVSSMLDPAVERWAGHEQETAP